MKKKIALFITLFTSLIIVGQTPNIIMPENNNSPGFEITYDLCDANFYDSGGINQPYKYNENGIVTFCPTASTERIRVDFSYLEIQANHVINVHDGDTDQAPLLATFTNTFGGQGTASASQTNTSGCLTVTFVSPSNLTVPNPYAGWRATVSCFTPSVEPGTPEDLYLNDDPSGDTIEIFDLSFNNIPILNGLSISDYSVTYYATLADAESGLNPLNTNHQNQGNPQTIYSRLENISSGVYYTNQFAIIVNTIPAILSIPDLVGCDDDGDFITNFILEDRLAHILNGRDNLNVTFYESISDRLLDTNPLNPTVFSNTLSPQTIYYRLTSINTGAYAFGDFLITVTPSPAITAPSTQFSCDDGSGSAMIDLFTLDSEIIGTQAGLNITYHETQADAGDGLSPLNQLYNYDNDTILYARIEDMVSGCANFTEVSLVFNELPVISLSPEYVICIDDAGNLVSGPALLDTGLDTTNYAFEWFLNNTPINGATNSSIAATTAGDYSVLIRNTTTNCPTSMTVVVRQASIPSSYDVQITSEIFAPLHKVIATAEGPDNYLFSIDGKPFVSSGIFNNVSSGPHDVTIMEESGCGTVTVNIYVVGYPKFFTPNNDGYNDSWSLKGGDVISITKLSVFDRYGKLLKQMNSPDQAWDGTFNGLELPVSDYWFKVEYLYNGTSLETLGHFTLKR